MTLEEAREAGLLSEAFVEIDRLIAKVSGGASGDVVGLSCATVQGDLLCNRTGHDLFLPRAFVAEHLQETKLAIRHRLAELGVRL